MVLTTISLHCQVLKCTLVYRYKAIYIVTHTIIAISCLNHCINHNVSCLIVPCLLEEDRVLRIGVRPWVRPKTLSKNLKVGHNPLQSIFVIRLNICNSSKYESVCAHDLDGNIYYFIFNYVNERNSLLSFPDCKCYMKIVFLEEALIHMQQ